MDRYSASGTQDIVTGTPGDSALGVEASTLTRAKLHFFSLSVGGTPADNVIQWLIRRMTAVGTRTAVTPSPIDSGSPAAQLTAGQDHTAEPTWAQTIFDLYVHQRNIYSWNASPGGELIIPATAGAGVGFTPIHAAYNQGATATAHWME